MAKKRDIIIAVVIAATFFITIGFFGLMFVGLMSESGDSPWGGFGTKVAIVEVYDGIYDSKSTIKQLKKWGESNSVSAIVLDINSPGGGIAPSQEIYNEILRIREEDNKVVVSSMSSVAASGGYYIACASDVIMANPGTITGSIGVILSYPTAGELFNKIGVKYETVKSGELKDVGSLDRNMTANERKMLSDMVMDSYEQFVEAIVAGRGMEKEDVYRLADGSIYSGRQAYYNGLIDTLGGFEDAVRLAAELAGISGKPQTVKDFIPEKGIFDLMGGVLKSVGQVTSKGGLGPEILYLY
ncbi:MAG: signal peptide peptidase SppA [candidate division Zixibacteria bacterium]|nr:signal peptide peptidase SppA [candidate division Zixibacteria bacterium]